MVNFDFPSSPVDYLHRTGRTARAGASGRITSLVAPRDRVLAQRVEWALTHGEALDALSGDKEVLPQSQRDTQTRAKENAKVPSRPGRGRGRCGRQRGRLSFALARRRLKQGMGALSRCHVLHCSAIYTF